METPKLTPVVQFCTAAFALAAGTAILAATAGKWCELVYDGTNWVIMAAN